MRCRRCDSPFICVSVQRFRNGSSHLRSECKDCGRFVGYLRQHDDAATFLLCFGKHRGKSLSQVMEADPMWVDWAIGNLKSSEVVERLQTLVAIRDQGLNLRGGRHES